MPVSSNSKGTQRRSERSCAVLRKERKRRRRTRRSSLPIRPLSLGPIHRLRLRLRRHRDLRPPAALSGSRSAATGEGKSTHALAFARTAALAGDRVVLVDADLRRSGVSRLLSQNLGFTLSDFLQGRCTAEQVIAVEERSGICFVPSTPVEAPWKSQDLQRFGELVDHLKGQFALIIIDMPPILRLAETMRLTVAA